MDIQVGKAAVGCSTFPLLILKKAWISWEHHRENAHSGECFCTYPTQKGWPEGKRNQQQDPLWCITGTERVWAKREAERMTPPTQKAGFLWRPTYLPKNSSRRTFSLRSPMREPPSKYLPPRGINNQSWISQRNNSNRKTKNDTEASAVILLECLNAPVR